MRREPRSVVGMRILPALALGGALLLLTACAAEPAVDLDEARTWLDTVEAEQSDGPGAAGAASMLVATAPDTPDQDDEHGIRMDFANPVALKRADARCFGGDGIEVEVSVEVRASDGSTMSLTGTIPCDQETHGIDLAAAPSPAVAATVDGHGSASTYLHVLLIQELTVER